MSPCPKCKCPVASHGAKTLRCWNCNAKLFYKEIEKDSAGLTRHIWTLKKHFFHSLRKP